MSNSNGDGMGRVRELDGHTTELVNLSTRFRSLKRGGKEEKLVMPKSSTHVAALILSSTSRKASSKARAVSGLFKL